jgi:nucleoside 2-deoxyribosyltransferase
MKITVCGSMTFYMEMRAIKDGLEILGHDVLLPKDVFNNVIPIEARQDVTDEEKITAKIEEDFIREHFFKIQVSEAILVLNYDKKDIRNYVGGNTFLEMGYAFGLGKKIFLMNPVPEMNYSIEMHSMKPVIIDGDLTKIR